MREFSTLIDAAYRMGENLSDHPFEERQRHIGFIAFSNTAAHALAVYQLAPKGPYQNQAPPMEFWHISSMAVLARSILDSYYTMFYVAVDDVSDELREFRLLLWDYHSNRRRIHVARAIKSTSPKWAITEASIDHVKDQIRKNPNYLAQDKETRKKIRQGNLPILATNTELSIRAGIDPEFYDLVFRFLSNYSHAHPLSIDMLSEYKAATEGGLREINTAVKFASIYLSFALRDFVKFFPDQSTELTENEEFTIDVLTGLPDEIVQNRGAGK